MLNENKISRRGLFMKLGILFNGLVATALAVPVVRFLMSSITRGTRRCLPVVGPSSVVSANFQKARRGLATFRNPYVMPTDGKDGGHGPAGCGGFEGDQFQIFAVNCAHLGCPVRWFPQSGLFMCPCHGGAYYRDGSRASGPTGTGAFRISAQN